MALCQPIMICKHSRFSGSQAVRGESQIRTKMPALDLAHYEVLKPTSINFLWEHRACADLTELSFQNKVPTLINPIQSLEQDKHVMSQSGGETPQA